MAPNYVVHGPAAKNLLKDQLSKLQAKHQQECELLDDMSKYMLKRAQIEKYYGDHLTKLSAQFLSKKHYGVSEIGGSKNNNVYTVWRNILEENEKIGKARSAAVDVYGAQISEESKNIRNKKLAVSKKCLDQLSCMHKELQSGIIELDKTKKAYFDEEHVTHDIRSKATEAEEKLRKKKGHFFQSLSSLQKQSAKLSTKRDVCEEKSTATRNAYLLQLAAVNAHLHRFYEVDLPSIAQTMEGEVYEKLSTMFRLYAETEMSVSSTTSRIVVVLLEQALQIDPVYNQQCYSVQFPVLSNPFGCDFEACDGDNTKIISTQYGANIECEKEARKWATRVLKESKYLREAPKKIARLEALREKGNKTDPDDPTGREIEALIDEVYQDIRKAETGKLKAEARLEALRAGGVVIPDLTAALVMSRTPSPSQSCVPSEAPPLAAVSPQRWRGGRSETHRKRRSPGRNRHSLRRYQPLPTSLAMTYNSHNSDPPLSVASQHSLSGSRVSLVGPVNSSPVISTLFQRLMEGVRGRKERGDPAKVVLFQSLTRKQPKQALPPKEIVETVDAEHEMAAKRKRKVVFLEQGCNQTENNDCGLGDGISSLDAQLTLEEELLEMASSVDENDEIDRLLHEAESRIRLNQNFFSHEDRACDEIVNSGRHSHSNRPDPSQEPVSVEAAELGSVREDQKTETESCGNRPVKSANCGHGQSEEKTSTPIAPPRKSVVSRCPSEVDNVASVVLRGPEKNHDGGREDRTGERPVRLSFCMYERERRMFCKREKARNDGMNLAEEEGKVLPRNDRGFGNEEKVDREEALEEAPKEADDKEKRKGDGVVHGKEKASQPEKEKMLSNTPRDGERKRVGRKAPLFIPCHEQVKEGNHTKLEFARTEQELEEPRTRKSIPCQSHVNRRVLDQDEEDVGRRPIPSSLGQREPNASTGSAVSGILQEMLLGFDRKLKPLKQYHHQRKHLPGPFDEK
ncbi:unnamed protein product [Cyprideis torosa]|uniref:Uncharacterized protein n=1 Tax=Cyprideis torosa TaxID=163714 RepID=A0A7R8WFQ1_9CRUS|nr:unnamed protein product [Cyprideis torosa]CAG0897271.1 unnamed protein product [Cyprideis torosa]